MKWKLRGLSILKSLLVLGLTTLLAIGLEDFDIRAENILLLYVGAVMFIDIETKSLFAGVASAVVSAALFNFLFTEPKYTFIVNDPNYLLSMVIFILVAFAVNALISRLQAQIRLSKENETRVNALYQLSKSLMTQHSIQSILDSVALAIQTSLNRKAGFVLRWSSKPEMQSRDFAFHLDDIREKLEWLEQGEMRLRLEEDLFSDIDRYVFPFRIKSLHGASAFLFVERGTNPLSTRERMLLDGAVSNMFIAFDRESSSEAREKAIVQIEREKLRTSLLRSISHDVKTPLTSLSAGTSLLIDSIDRVSPDEIRTMLIDINEEATSLSEFVDNLLNLTRIDSNRLLLHRRIEVVDDLLEEVVKRTTRRLGKHPLHVLRGDEVLMIDADSTLIIQVLVNLIDNAVKHTREDCEIWIRVFYDNNQSCIEVKDDGGGIDPILLPDIFADFALEKSSKSDRSRGTGLGLNICKAIIEAHEGSIRAWNNEIGGASFQICIPFRSRKEATK